MAAPKNYSTSCLTNADEREVRAVLAANPLWKRRHARDLVARRKFFRAIAGAPLTTATAADG